MNGYYLHLNDGSGVVYLESVETIGFFTRWGIEHVPETYFDGTIWTEFFDRIPPEQLPQVLAMNELAAGMVVVGVYKFRG